MTVQQLGEAMLWGMLGGLPLFFLGSAMTEKKELPFFRLLFSIATQIGFGVACYSAGWLR